MRRYIYISACINVLGVLVYVPISPLLPIMYLQYPLQYMGVGMGTSESSEHP